MEKSYLKETIGNRSVVEKITDNITNAIINGEVRPGDKLPTETELCEAMGVGRNSIREAVKILEAYGVVNIKRAEGTFISAEYNSKMLYPILYGIILQQDSGKQMVELRKVIDIGLLQVVMEKVTKEDMQRIETAMSELSEAVTAVNADARQIYEADVQFHSEVAGVTGNVMLAGICSYVDKITSSSRIAAIEQILESESKDRFLKLHQNLVTILREKSNKKIAEAVEEHYQYWQKVKNESE